MCSIIGIISKNLAAPALVKSLQRMEYRGYDSVGLATISRDGKIILRKGVGKVKEVNSNLKLDSLDGYIGIGHTRWATHGSVTDYNAHPHSCCTGNIAVVHNGIIENYQKLKSELVTRGHIFKSETDTEVIAHLLEENYSQSKNIKDAIIKSTSRIEGTYAFLAMFEDGRLACARLDEPLVIGVGKDAFYASSDVLGFLEYTDHAIFLDNQDIAIIDNKGIEMFDFSGSIVSRKPTKVAWELADANKGEFAHYTLKEIYEQKTSIISAISQEIIRVETFCNAILDAKKILVTGSGTSYHTSLITSMLGSKYLKKHFEAIMASEFQYVSDSMDQDTLLIAISQSGETADVLSATKIARKNNSKVLSIVNVPSSSLARNADISLSINCGPEIGVAATKSFTGQVALAYSVIDKASNGKLGFDRNAVSESIASILENIYQINKLVYSLNRVNDIYLLGRSLHFPVALEGALKMKELAYVHAEGIAAGELKHGPLALMDKNAYVFVLNPGDKTYQDMLSSAHEVKARGAKIIGISNLENDIYDFHLKIPEMQNETLYPLIEVIPLQIFSYFLAVQNNVDPDFPRNLAKSVTVK